MKKIKFISTIIGASTIVCASPIITTSCSCSNEVKETLKLSSSKISLGRNQEIYVSINNDKGEEVHNIKRIKSAISSNTEILIVRGLSTVGTQYGVIRVDAIKFGTVTLSLTVLDDKDNEIKGESTIEVTSHEDVLVITASGSLGGSTTLTNNMTLDGQIENGDNATFTLEGIDADDIEWELSGSTGEKDSAYTLEADNVNKEAVLTIIDASKFPAETEYCITATVGENKAEFKFNTPTISSVDNFIITTDDQEIQLMDNIDPNEFVVNGDSAEECDLIKVHLKGKESEDPTEVKLKDIKTLTIKSCKPDVDTIDTSIGYGFLDMGEITEEDRHITSIDLSGFSTIKDIGSHFLYDCCTLTSINFNGFNNVTNIGVNFLRNCKGLTEVDLTPLTKIELIGILTYDGYFLDNCNKLATIKLPQVTGDIPTLTGWGQNIGSDDSVTKVTIDCGTTGLKTKYTTDTNWNNTIECSFPNGVIWIPA